ncbi:MurR/RpiR family transcriptional regulator [Desertihabitans brevis]|uniref:MurR/RpiR family transcriptional regulator n=1 Tax=Desertihabitans brevis TaxID=2268447 RepID=A0A367YWA3_9ACTN|nr:MurR/RpiR family transcriptional regulator [Desertihabitans brevis]
MRDVDRALTQSPMQQIRDALPGLNAAMARVAQLVLDHPQEVGRAPITRLAEQAGTSPATVTRLAVLLGYDGYPALRAAIAEENGRDAQAAWESDIGRMISPDDPADQVLTTLAGTQANAMRVALGAIDLPTATRVADAIAAAGRIHLFGEWGDSIAMQELHLRLLRIGRPCWFHSGRQESQVVASLLGAGDVALTLSRSGNDPVAEDFLGRAREHGARTVLITGVAGTPLERVADEVLLTGTPNGSAWTDYFGGRTSDVLAASLLFVLVAQRSADSLERAFTGGAHPDARDRPPPSRK